MPGDINQVIQENQLIEAQRLNALPTEGTEDVASHIKPKGEGTAPVVKPTGANVVPGVQPAQQGAVVAPVSQPSGIQPLSAAQVQTLSNAMQVYPASSFGVQAMTPETMGAVTESFKPVEARQPAPEPMVRRQDSGPSQAEVDVASQPESVHEAPFSEADLMQAAEHDEGFKTGDYKEFPKSIGGTPQAIVYGSGIASNFKAGARKKPKAVVQAPPKNVFEETGDGRTVISQAAIDAAKKGDDSNILKPSTKRSRLLAEREENATENAMRDFGRGNRVYGKLLGVNRAILRQASQVLDLRDVAVGKLEILDCARSNPEHLNDLFNDTLAAEGSQETVDVSDWTLQQFIDFTEAHLVWVAFHKAPDVTRGDVSRRRLRIALWADRGVFIHSIMAAQANADMDGDDVMASLERWRANVFNDPMETVVGIDKALKFDLKFFPPHVGRPGLNEPASDTYMIHYIETCLIGYEYANQGDITKLEEAILAIFDAYDDTSLKLAWHGVLVAAREYSYTIRASQGAANKVMNDIVKNIYDELQKLNEQKNYAVVGYNPDVQEIIDIEDMPVPKTKDYECLVWLVNEVQKSKEPINMQELRVMMHSYLGLNPGSSAPFRQTGDVGKAVKMSAYMQQKDGTFLMDINSDRDMLNFHFSLTKYCFGRRMQHEQNKQGREFSLYEDFCDEVRNEVRFRNSTKNGVPMYESTLAWITRFCEVYSRTAARYNMASAVVSMDMSVNLEDAPIKRLLGVGGGDPVIREVAAALQQVYPFASLKSLLPNIMAYATGEDMKRTRWSPMIENTSWRSYARRRHWDTVSTKDGKSFFWIDDAYADMDVVRFVNENQLMRKDNNREVVNDRSVYTNYDKDGLTGNGPYGIIKTEDACLEWDLLQGLADKRTSTASKFNEKTYGKIGDRGRTDTRAGMVAAAAAEISALNNQGVVFESNFYAGIGSRNIPKGERGEAIGSAITSLATELANEGYILRSGGAEGSDTLFQNGAGSQADIYRPWENKDSPFVAAGRVQYVDQFDDDLLEPARLSVERLHPGAKKLGQFAFKLHQRNYFQICGMPTEPDVGFVACYMPDSGGTTQAVRIAEQRGIRVFNLAEYDSPEEWKADVLAFAREHKGFGVKHERGPLFRRRYDPNQMAYANAAANLITAAGGEYFRDLCIDSPRGLLSSNWMLKLMEHANNVKKVGGIMLAVVYKHHIDALNHFAQRIPVAGEGKATAYMNAYNKWAYMRDKLMAKSPAWRGIIMELTAEATDGERSFFDHMINNRAKNVQDRVTQTYDQPWIRNRETKWLEHYEANSFWANRGVIDEKAHPTLESLIMDLDVDVDTKMSVICDVVRWHLQNPYINNYEIGYMMEIGNDGVFSVEGTGKTAALQTYHDVSTAYTSWKRDSITLARENYRLAAARWKNVEGALVDAVTFLADNPWELVDFPDEAFANALIAVKDPVYGMTEKNSQHPGMHFLFTGLSQQRNDGFMCNVDIVQDRLFGISPVSTEARLSTRDLISILADPKKSYVYYNEVGKICKLDRDTIMDRYLPHRPTGNFEQDLWDLFETMPNLMFALRRHRIGATPGIEGDTYVGAVENSCATIGYAHEFSPVHSDVIKAAKFYLRDEPAYGAIVSLITKSPETFFDEDLGIYRRRQAAPILEVQRLMDVENWLCQEIVIAARSAEGEPEEQAIAILADAGASLDDILLNLESSFDEFCRHNGIPNIENKITRRDKEGNVVSEYDEREDTAHLLYDYARDRLASMIMAIRKRPDVGTINPKRRKYTSNSVWQRRNEKPQEIIIDDFHKPGYEFLSNMYESEITYEGITYRCAEAAFQAQKYALGTKDRRKKQLRFAKMDGYEARKAGKAIRSFDAAEWNARKVDVMRAVQIAKYSNPILMQKLKDTGIAHLVEGNGWGDTFWGVSQGVGKNMLGKILMEVRDAVNAGIAPRPPFIGVDQASVASFNAVAVELSGSKTAKMVGVEGAQSWRYGHWAAYIASHDRYADLGWVLDDIDESWNGVWTSARDGNGDTIFLEYTEEGNNLDVIMASGDEIAIACPDGYVVKDAFLDRHSTNVDSVTAFNNTRRADGAEKNALKIKKTGLDLLNSIVKIAGRRRTTIDENGRETPVSLLDVRDNLRKIYDSYEDKGQALMEVKLSLAREMQEENESLEYNDLALGQYMCLADLMVFICEEDDQLYFRTLPMLFTAIRNRAGQQWREYSDDQQVDFATSIAYDRSANAVGVQEFDPLEALASYSPRGMAGPKTVVKGSSSFFPRNIELLDTLRNDTKNDVLGDSDATRIDESIMATGDVRDLVLACEFTRNYKVVYARGIKNKENPDEKQRYADEAEAITKAENDSVMSVGGTTRMAVIGSEPLTEQQIRDICEQCWKHGLSLLVSAANARNIPDPHWRDARVASDFGDLFIPMFELKLNGSEAHPVAPSFASFYFDESDLVYLGEDTNNFYGLSDAQVKATEHYANRVRGFSIKPKTIVVEDLFPNVFQNPRYPDSEYTKHIDFLTHGEIVALAGREGLECTTDYGVPYSPNSEMFRQAKWDVDQSSKRYFDRFQNLADDNGWIMNDVRKGDTICWLKCIITNKITGDRSVVVAPVILFPMGKSGRAPETCEVIEITPNNNWSEIRVTYAVERTLKNTVSKFYGADSNANKGMIDAYDTIPGNLTLKNGALLDAIVAAATTGGRKEGTDNRLKTMYSMMAVARAANYNLALRPTSFPNHPDLKRALSQGLVDLSVWRDLLKPNEVFPFTNDEGINALLTSDCLQMMYNGHNPSHLLATYFVTEEGNVFFTGFGWEYDALITPTISYEDKFLKWMHFMDIDCGNGVKLSPNGIYDASREYLFALRREGDDIATGFNRGVLQMCLPFEASPGKISYVWNNTYVGFSHVSDDSTMNNSPNVDNAAGFPDSLTMASQTKLRLPKHIHKQLANRGVSDFGLLEGSPYVSGPSVPVGVNGFAFLEDEDEDVSSMDPSEFVDACTERIKLYLDENRGTGNMSGFGAILSAMRRGCVDRGLDQNQVDELIKTYYNVGSRVILPKQ